MTELWLLDGNDQMPFMWAITQSRCVVAIALLAMSTLAGCGSGDEITRLAITGSVSGSGSVNGSISFRPKGNGPAVATEVRDGKFAFTAEDGPIAGEYEVTVETTVHSKGGFLRASKSKTSDEASPNISEWKFSVTVSADQLELKPLVLSNESAKTPDE